jgi:hypothetical protein
MSQVNAAGGGNYQSDDPEFLADLVRTTAAALPNPKVKAKKTRRSKSKFSGRKAIA